MLEAIRAEDLPSLEALARHSHPICLASAPAKRCVESGCPECPTRDHHGGCERLITQILYAARFHDWHAAEDLVLALVSHAEEVRVRLRFV
jgi:hypothetical protein